VRYFEESTDALVRDRGFRDLMAGAYTATAGWAGGAPPDPLYTLFARTEAAMRDHHIRLVRRAQAAGVLRADIDATDMLVLTMSVQATAGLAAAARRLRHPPPRSRHRARWTPARPHRTNAATRTAANRRRTAPQPANHSAVIAL
jgi:hypothetical protein